MNRRTVWVSVLAIVAVCLVANALLLDDFWRLVRQDDLALSGSDMSTHLLRVRHAKELYLPSGHRFGWDPYWFQGFVPFVLYPHLTYVAVAVAGMVLPVGIERLFNLYVLSIFFSLPLAGGLSVLRPLGSTAALVVTSWLAVLSTTTSGLIGVFVVGLLSQQVGTVLFTLLAVDLVITRRIDRAAIWLGLIPLVHIHAALIAAVAWICAGAAALLDADERETQLRTWLTSSVLAVIIASPTALGLLYGWGSIGGSTSYTESDAIFTKLVSGTLIAPVPTMLALAVCFVTALFVAPVRDRTRLWLCWAPFGLLLFAVSIHKWNVGVPLADRILSTLLFLRTFPFAFAWVAIVAICYWNRFPTAVRVVVVALSLVSLLLPRFQQPMVERSIGSAWRGSAKGSAKSVVEYRSALRWIAGDLGKDTTTLAVRTPKPHGTWLAEAIERCGQPLIGGHGIELTSINNDALVTQTLGMQCEQIKRQVRDYAIGYLLGSSSAERTKFEDCLGLPASYTRGIWWVIATGRRWAYAGPAGTGFRRDRTWTNLEWTLDPPARSVEMRLPIAMSTKWTADVDGRPVAIEPTEDRMMRVTLPKGGERLTLRYEGYAGEWLTVAASILALAAAVLRTRRSGAGVVPPASSSSL